jgi:ribosomal-protein-alanine N-acetyltransferase
MAANKLAVHACEGRWSAIVPFLFPSPDRGNVMSHRIETERLLLRPPERSDIPQLVALIGEWDVAKNLGRVPYPYSEADAHAFFDRVDARPADQTDLTLGVTLKPGGAYIGGCGVHLRENGEFELGYWIGKPHWGTGYATEAARAVAGEAFTGLGLQKLTAGYFFDNPASGHVLEKLGFRPDGEEQRDCASRGHRVRCHNVVLMREQFAVKQVA